MSQIAPSPAPSSHRFASVVVLGGSFAGLLAARVLAPHAARVIVIERDRPPRLPAEPRKGVPQGQHAHVLLQTGLDGLASLFPDIEGDLEAVAGTPIDLMQETRWKIDGRFRPRFASDYRAYALGRPALESIVRRRVARLDDVTFTYGQVVKGLTFADGAVSGVRLATGETLHADLVVDASGRGTQVPRWLAEAGFETAPVDTTELDLTYTSCVIAPKGGVFPHDFRLLLLPPVPPHRPLGGLLTPLEHGRYLATLLRYGGEPARLEWSAFRDAAREVDDPLLAEVLDGCEPVTEPVAFAMPTQRWHRYDRARGVAARLVVLGDALCSFDPAFGQGLSVCTLETLALARLLDRPGLALDALLTRFYADCARIIESPWGMAKVRQPDATAGGNGARSWLRSYQRALLFEAAESPALHRAFARVVHLEAAPSSLLAPGIVARVLLGRMRGAQAGAARVRT